MERVEHIFAFMEYSMNGIYLHYRNLGRVSGGIGLMNLTYNLFRLVQLLVTRQRLRLRCAQSEIYGHNKLRKEAPLKAKRIKIGYLLV
jgi:hypothetical protein